MLKLKIWSVDINWLIKLYELCFCSLDSKTANTVVAYNNLEITSTVFISLDHVFRNLLMKIFSSDFHLFVWVWPCRYFG